MSASASSDNKDHSDLIKVYDQLCQSYRAIDDFRAKLLDSCRWHLRGGVFLLLNEVLVNPEKSKAKPFLEPFGFFGFVITLGLFFLRNLRDPENAMSSLRPAYNLNVRCALLTDNL